MEGGFMVKEIPVIVQCNYIFKDIRNIEIARKF